MAELDKKISIELKRKEAMFAWNAIKAMLESNRVYPHEAPFAISAMEKIAQRLDDDKGVTTIEALAQTLDIGNGEIVG